MEIKEVEIESGVFREKVARIAVTRNILAHVKSQHAVNKVPTYQFGEWIQLDDHVANLCDAGLIRHLGDAQYSITMKGLRFLDIIERFEQTAGQSPGSATNLFPEVA